MWWLGQTGRVNRLLSSSLSRLCCRSLFVNSDEIARQRWPADPVAHAYDAARVAAATREVLIRRGVAFIAETVFSHPSKLELVHAAQLAGYTVNLHVLLIPEELAVQRVSHRVSVGGHNVPECKIRERYQRLWALVGAAMTRVEFATVYDNSALKGPRIVAQMSGGYPIGAPIWPTWTPEALLSRWPK